MVILMEFMEMEMEYKGLGIQFKETKMEF